MEKEKPLMPLYGRIGSKRTFLKTIREIMPEHSTYIEPFFGGGAVFWNKEKSKKEIINDIDPTVYQILRDLKKIDRDRVQEIGRSIPSSVEAIQSFVDKDYNDIERNFVKNVFTLNNTFSNKGVGKIYKDRNPFNRKDMNKYYERIKDAKVFNKDYKSIIRKYDAPDAFFFIDPPYEDSKTLYKHESMDFNELKGVLDGIKGKFLLTMNYSKNIKDLFKDYTVWKVKKKMLSENTHGPIGSKPRYELFITNY